MYSNKEIKISTDKIKRAAGTVEDPNGLAPNRYIYYPGTEQLGSDEIEHFIREQYDSPLSLAKDMMVWNITKDRILVREAVSPDEAWNVKLNTKASMNIRTCLFCKRHK